MVAPVKARLQCKEVHGGQQLALRAAHTMAPCRGQRGGYCAQLFTSLTASMLPHRSAACLEHLKLNLPPAARCATLQVRGWHGSSRATRRRQAATSLCRAPSTTCSARSAP